MKYSIIIPAYNEERRIGRTLDDYCSFFSTFPRKDVEIIVVLNGCKDNTLGVVKRYARAYPFLSYLNILQAIGKGGAVIEGFKMARGDLVGFADADGATRATYFFDLVSHIKGVDGVIASRWMKAAVVEPPQPLDRKIASRSFNLLIRLLFGLRYHDSQCGCKLFRRQALRVILPSLGTTRWAFDVDLLYQMKRYGFVVREVPTVWRDVVGSKINVKKVSLEMLLAIIRLRLLYSPLKFVVGTYNRVADFLGIKL